MNRNPVSLELSDLGVIYIGANHTIPGFGQAGTDDKTNIPRSDHGNVHSPPPSALRVSTTLRNSVFNKS